MEGHERANVEARIKCLRNIQVLLDAAVMEMQQYSSVVSQLDMTSLRRSEAMPRSSSSNSNAVVASPPPSTASSSSSLQEPQPTSETGARPKVKPEKPKEDNNCDSSETTNDEQDEVRKRRLERFGAQAE